MKKRNRLRGELLGDRAVAASDALLAARGERPTDGATLADYAEQYLAASRRLKATAAARGAGDAPPLVAPGAATGIVLALDRKIRDFYPLSVRACNAFAELGFTHVRDLARLTEAQASAAFLPKTAREVGTFLASLGLAHAPPEQGTT